MLNKRLYAFYVASRGIVFATKEPHMKLHIMSAIAVCGLGNWLNISQTDWMFISFSILLVISFEMINTAIEHAIDAHTDTPSHSAKLSKDIAAGAVLLSSIHAILIAWWVFYAPLLEKIAGASS